MLATLIIVFREVFEAGLAVGIVAAATGRSQAALRYIWSGLGLGVLGSIVLAILAGTLLSSFGGLAEELIVAGILIFAVVLLAWHTIWMARQGRNLAAELKAVGQDVVKGSKPLRAIALVIAAIVLREGAETVLFIYGAVASSGATFMQTLTGILGGALLGLIVSMAIYQGLVRISMRWIFAVTSALIALVASGMAAQATHILQEVGVTKLLQQQVWDLEAVLPEEGLLGGTLHSLLGYNDKASLLMLVVFALTLLVFAMLNRLGPVKPAAA